MMTRCRCRHFKHLAEGCLTVGCSCTTYVPRRPGRRRSSAARLVAAIVGRAGLLVAALALASVAVVLWTLGTEARARAVTWHELVKKDPGHVADSPALRRADLLLRGGGGRDLAHLVPEPEHRETLGDEPPAGRIVPGDDRLDAKPDEPQSP